MPPKASQQQLMRTVFLFVTFVALAIFSASCGGGGIQNNYTMVNPPTVSLSPLTLNFGSQSTGSSSRAQVITLTNTGGGVVTISSFAVSGDFSQTNNCGTSVAVGSSCTISVMFTPTGSGTRSGTLSISDNAPGSPQMVTLSGTGGAAAVSLTPPNVTFPSQPAGTASGTQPVTLTNTGNATLTIASITASDDFILTNNCGTSVAAGSSCTISVIFKPTSIGTRSGTLSISDNAPASPQMVALSGTGAATGPAVSLTSANVTFPNQPVGTASGTQSVRLTNTGNAALTIASITASSDFSQTNNCGTSVAAGSSCTITVMFKPTGSGTRSGTLSISDSAPGSPQMVTLSGTGGSAGPTVSLLPASVTFSSQPVGTTSGTQPVMLTNTGNAALTIANITASGDFTQTNNCGTSVAGGSSCTITLMFTPTGSGTRSGTLSISDNAPGSPQMVTLGGTGGAAGAAVTLTPASVIFPSQPVGTTSTPQTITLANTGSATLTIATLAVTGTSAKDFAQTNTCSSSLAAGTNCTVSITFTPSASGSRSASLTVSDNAAGSPQTVSLSGTGIAGAVSLSATSLSFGSQPVGTTSTAQTTTLTNTGSVPLSITSIAFTGTNANNFAQTNTCSTSLGAGAKCTISITFIPSGSGSRSASLTVVDNAVGSPQTVSLSGTGTAPAVGLSPASLSFESQPVGTTSTVQTITVTNTGGAPLQIASFTVTGAAADDFAETETCGSSVAAGTPCTIAVMFTPSAYGSRLATLSITDNANGSPQTVGLSGLGGHDVILSWTASATPGVMGYNVFRGTTSGQESSTPLNPTPINGTTYIDENVIPGGTYYYVVTAVAAEGVIQSVNSNESAATVPAL
jgi:hypothetical protein